MVERSYLIIMLNAMFFSMASEEPTSLENASSGEHPGGLFLKGTSTKQVFRCRHDPKGGNRLTKSIPQTQQSAACRPNVFRPTGRFSVLAAHWNYLPGELLNSQAWVNLMRGQH